MRNYKNDWDRCRNSFSFFLYLWRGKLPLQTTPAFPVVSRRSMHLPHNLHDQLPSPFFVYTNSGEDLCNGIPSHETGVQEACGPSLHFFFSPLEVPLPSLSWHSLCWTVSDDLTVPPSWCVLNLPLLLKPPKCPFLNSDQVFLYLLQRLAFRQHV